tara:strand:- start:205 stop:318 length:114 start_codon:yes stop_codon:yes gene_type:complete
MIGLRQGFIHHQIWINAPEMVRIGLLNHCIGMKEVIE